MILPKEKKELLINRDFAIISNNCWGNSLYQEVGLPYNTPFVGLYLYAPCYIKLLTDFKFYLNSTLTFTGESRYINNIGYPVGILNEEIEIHFVHYPDSTQAYEKWNRRRDRLPTNLDQYYFKLCDRDSCTDELVLAYHSLPFKNKISFTSKQYNNCRNNFQIADYEVVPEGPELFKISGELLHIYHWINTGEIIAK